MRKFIITLCLFILLPGCSQINPMADPLDKVDSKTRVYRPVTRKKN